jgi:5-methylcytosine-specific restriction endonuclease McrA
MDSTITRTPNEVIDAVRAALKAEQAAGFAQLELALEWALLHPCPQGDLPAHWGAETLHTEDVLPLAGPGAPWVAEFAPVELAAALGISHHAARQLIGDALELAYRLPRLWDLARHGRVPVWRARRVAQQTSDLSIQAASFADRLIAATPDKIGRVETERLINEARLYFDPDRAIDDEQHALAKRGVWVRHGCAPATTEVVMTLDTPDAELFENTIARIAHDLGELGDTDHLDGRRARAVGILADPQHALDLMSGREAARPSRTGGAANLYVHLTPADIEAELDGETGAASIERLGAATTRLLTDWLTRYAETGARINLRPVLDLTAEPAVDQHDPPAAMREQVVLRDSHCVFPSCRRDSRSCDLDHITEYVLPDDGGPPGQTRPDNLAPLCRTHHRAKTHSAWHYKRLDDGSYTWTSPTGHQYDVDPTPRRPPPTKRRT